MFYCTCIDSSGGYVALTKAQIAKILQLAGEGKQIEQIRAVDFPAHTYTEIHEQVSGKNAQGVQWMITARLNKMISAGTRQERELLSEQLKNLTRIMYDNHKTSYIKLDKIRKALDA